MVGSHAETGSDYRILVLLLAGTLLCVLAAKEFMIALASAIALCILVALVLNYRWAFYAFLFALPFATWEIIPLPGVDNIAVLMVILLALSLLVNIHRLPPLRLNALGAKPWLMAGFIAAAVPGVLFTINQVSAVRYLVLAAAIIGLYFVATLLLRDERERNFAVHAFLAGVLLSSIIILIDFAQYPMAMQAYRAGSIYSHGISVTLTFVLAVPLSLLLLDAEKRWWGRIFYCAVALGSTAIILFSATRSSWIALLLFIIYYIVKHPVRGLVVTMVLALVVAVLVRAFLPATYQFYAVRTIASFRPELRPQEDVGFRIENYSVALNMFASYPLLGVGLNNFAAYASRFGRATIPADQQLEAHNAYLEVFTGVGLIGGLAYMLVWLLTLYELAAVSSRGPPRLRPLAAGFGIGFSMLMVHSMFHSMYIVLLLVPIFAIASALREEMIRCRSEP